MLRTLTSALSLAVVAAVTLAAPVHAAPGAGTVAIQGDAGDYITEGLSYAYSSPGDRISLSGDAQHVAVTSRPRTATAGPSTPPHPPARR